MGKKSLKIALTLEQKEQIRKATGKEVPAVKLCVEPLEQRAAPLNAIVTN